MVCGFFCKYGLSILLSVLLDRDRSDGEACGVAMPCRRTVPYPFRPYSLLLRAVDDLRTSAVTDTIMTNPFLFLETTRLSTSLVACVSIERASIAIVPIYKDTDYSIFQLLLLHFRLFSNESNCSAECQMATTLSSIQPNGTVLRKSLPFNIIIHGMSKNVVISRVIVKKQRMCPSAIVSGRPA